MSNDRMAGFLLADAIAKGSLAEVRRLLDVSLIDAAPSDTFGTLRPLHIAAANGHPAVCEFLLEQGASVSIAADVRQFTPLHFALDRAPTIARAKVGTQCCQMLLKAGAPVNAFSLGHHTPLHFALTLIVSDPTRSSNAGELSSIGREAMRMIELLIEHGADPSVVPDLPAGELRGYLTPFQRAVEKNNEPVMRYLVDTCEIDFGQRTVDGKTLLQLAKRQGAKDLLRSTKVVRQVRDVMATGAPSSTFGPKVSGMSPL
jgi:ankyrin repeat protein